MEGPFTLIRNKWQKTPLERIEQAISEVKEELNSCETEETENLTKTLETLESEKEKRIAKVRKLKNKREKLIKRLGHIRKSKFFQRKDEIINEVFEEIKEIDDELGPYRTYDQPFYLA